MSIAASVERQTITVSPGERREKPIILSSDLPDHIVLEVGEGASVTVLDEVGGSRTVEINVKDHAHVEYVSLLFGVAVARIRQTASVGTGAAVQWRNITLGGSDIEHDLVSQVRGDGGESTVDWIFMARGTDRLRLSAKNVFSAGRGKGVVTMKGVAQDRARVGCHGMIEIGSAGTGTDAYLAQDVLMLDPTARVDAVPALEIRTDDVKASHGAKVRRVTPEELFYLSSRGIPTEEARRLYIAGFLGDVIGCIASAAARERVFQSLASF